MSIPRDAHVETTDGAKLVPRVLIVDDDPTMNHLLQIYVSAHGYGVEAVTTGEQALARLAETPIDLMFLDVSMPGIGGLEVLERIRAQALDVAVIMTTAFGSEQVVIDALRHGADDYLRKPVEPTEFRVVLQRTVDRLHLRRQNAMLRRQLEVELARAAEVQAQLLPQAAPSLRGFELAARCIPAREVGGDFYDWQVPAPGVLTFTLCDVMGKGMPAALMMATVRATMRAVVRESLPASALAYLMQALGHDLARANQFVTLFLARLDTASCQLTFADAGHGHVFLRHADGSIEQLAPRGFPLGIFPDETYCDGVISLMPDDALILYSDGLLDARPEALHDQHALAAQLMGVRGADEAVQRLLSFAGGVSSLPDDLTVVVLWRCAGAGRVEERAG